MKNLITYLKALWSRVSGLESRLVGVTLGEATIGHPFSTYSAPFGTCWQPSGKLHSVVRCAAMLVMLFIIGSGNVWGDSYTITFSGTNSESTGISTSTTAASITGSSSYVTGNVAAATKAYGATSSGIKLGTSSAAGSIKINLSASGQVTPTSIVVNAKRYNSSTAASLGVNGSTKQSLTSSYADYTFNITSAITYIQLDVSKYSWVKSITVNYGSGGGGGGDCNAIDVTGGSAVILPNGSTTVSANDWKNAGAPTSYAAEDEYTIGSGEYCVTLTQTGDFGNANGLQLKASAGIVSVTGITSNSGVDVEILISSGSGFSIALTGATTLTGQSSGTKTISTTSTSADLTISKTSSGAGYIKYIKVSPKAASCDASPSVGNAANNGALVYSTTPMTVPITCPSIGAGDGCEINDYGFVWRSGGNPTIANNKTQIGTDNHSTAFNGNISGTFAAGTTYYVKAYAINTGDNTTLSSGTYSFTPRSITMNSNGGSAVATILVISGTAATQPVAPTKEGYTFGGWYTDNGTFASAVDWSSNITSNQTYYAKWTVKTYDITLDREGATSGATGVTMTYNSSSFTGWSAPSKEGNTFGGYWTEDNGTGTMVINASGVLQANVTNYTGEGGIWTKDATCTLYAKWTPINYTVTWMSNGSQHTTTSVSYGSRPTLPSNPSSCDATSDTFYGWSTAEWTGALDDVSAKTIYTDASAMPAVTGNVTYYAVFAKAVKSDNYQMLYDVNNFISGEDYLIDCYYSSTDHVLKAANYNSLSYQQVSYNSWTLPSKNTNFAMTDANFIWKITSEGNGHYSMYNATTGKYLVLVTVSSYKNLILSDTKDASFIRTVDTDGDDTYKFESTSVSGYYIYCNGSYYKAENEGDWLYLYKRVTTYSKYITNCCTELGTINGSITLTNEGCTPTQLKATWKMSATTGIASQTLKVYKSSDDSEVTGSKITGISASTSNQTQTITGLNPCETYYVKVENVSSGGSFCEGGVAGTSSTATTLGYTLTVTKSNCSISSGSEPARICSNVSVTYSASTGYALPTSITVTNAGAQNTGWTWNSGTGVLTINKANVTGNVTVTITPTCVSPVIGTDPADASYYVGDSPDALSVSATLASGTLTYLWKVSTNGGSTWSDAEGTNNTASYSGASLSASSAGTTKFKCIVGNSQGGCIVESGVATITVTAASYFVNGATVFIQADSKDYSAWKDDACVKAWFNNNWSGGSAETTYWLFDATDTDAGKKLFATVVPASGDLNIVQLQRFAGNCSDKWNDNGSVNKASSNGVNTFRSYGSADNNVAWNGSSTTLSLYGSQNSWASSLATFTDQGSGVWTASFNNYAPDATSKDYKIKTSYNNGWIGNTGSNNNATLSGMIVGSTYNVTATLDVTAHSLVMSKEFVKGEVSFDLQGHGDAIAKLTNVTAGSKISAPSPAPTATGYTFGGWYKEPACTNAWNFASDVVNETMTLYAKWTVNSHTLAWNWGGGSTSATAGTNYTAPGSVNFGTAITYPASNTMSKPGYNFSSWSSDATTMPDNDLTITASWTAKTYTITLDREGADSGAESVTATYDAGTLTGWSAPSKTGYTFGGYWSGDNGTGTLVISTTGVLQNSVTISAVNWTDASGHWIKDGGVTLYAKWTANEYTITYKDEGNVAFSGSNSASLPGTHTYGAATALVDGVKDGYRFDGWYDNSACTGVAVTSIGATAITANTTYYAKWTIKNFTVSWKWKGDVDYTAGVDGTNNNANWNTTVSAPTAPADNSLDCADKFMGWSTHSWGSTTGKDDSDYDDLFTTTSPAITDNTTFYAVFASASGSGTSSEELTNSEIKAGVSSASRSYGTEYETTDGEISYAFSVNVDAANRPWVQMNKENSSAYIKITAPGNITRVDLTITTATNSSGGMEDISKHTKLPAATTINLNTAASTNSDNSVASVAGDGTSASRTITVSSPANKTLYLQPIGGACRIWGMTVYYTSVTYSDYVTACCSLKPVTGLTVSSMTANSVTLSWTAPSPTTGIDHLELRNASTDAKIGSNIAVGTTTTSVSGLTECNTYSYKIVSVGASCETSSDAIEAQPFSGAKTVTFNYNGGSGTPTSFTTSCAGNTVSLPTPDTRAGFTFLGWWSAQNGGTKRGDAGDTYTVTGTTTLWAHWSVINYTVTMAQSPAAGATLTGGTTTANYGNTIDISTDVPSGYRFTGWTADPSVTFADASATSTSFSMPASDVTITANFVQIHTLTFDVPDGGGSAVTPPATADHGGTVTLPGTTGKDAEFSCETFLGWTTTAPNAEGGTKWSSTPTIKAAGATSDVINSNTTFYAVYSRSGGGASGTVELTGANIGTWYTSHTELIANGNIAYGTSRSITVGDYTWTTNGYQQGAQTSDYYLSLRERTHDNGVSWIQIPTMPGDINTITFSVTNGGSAATTNVLYFQSGTTSGESVIASSESTSSMSRTIEVSGSHTGGYITANGAIKVRSITVSYGPAPIISHALHCDCEVTQFDLTYNANTAYFDGSTISCDGVDDYAWAAHDDIYTICATEPTCAGYKFIGWNTQANGSGEDGRLYQPGEEVTCWPEANMTLYARYERVYTVTFNNQGTITSRTQGSAGASVKVPNHTTPCTDDEHEPDEYTWAFAGWSTTPTLSNSLTPNLVLNATTGAYNADYTPTDDITLYAVYQKTTTTSPTFQNGKTGAYNLSAINSVDTYYATSKYNNGYYSSTTPPATDPIVYFTYNEAGTYAGLYTIQSSDGYYASATSSASTFSWKETPDATCYLKATAVTGGWRFEWWNGSATGSYFTHSGRFGQFRSTGDPLILTPAAGSTYFTTMTCSSTFDMTFSMSSGVIDYGAGSSADYLNKADGTVISTFPTATLDGWTFIGWTAGSQYNDLYDVSGYYSDQNSSNTDPIASPAVGGAIYGGSYGGTAYTMHSDIVMYPVFTKFEDNVAFDEINGGDYYIYFLDENREDTYGAYKRVYATSYDGEKRYTSTASCASATLFTFTKLPNGNWTIQDKTTGNYLYGIADDWLKQQASTTGAEWTLTLNGSQFDAFHVGTSYGQISANGNGNSAIFQNYRRTNISDNPTVYHRVYLGSCAERIFSSNPTNTPEITFNGEAGIITSSQNGAIRGTNVLSVSGSQLTADITISSNSSDIYFSTSASSSFALAGAYQPKTEITIAKDGSGIVNPTTVYVHYKPSTNTDTWVTKTITASSTGADDQTKDVNLRIVQENFVIASKVGDTWYALPADMSSAGVYEPVLIEVDESSKVAYGPSTVAYKMWPVQTVNGGTDEYAANGDKVRFAGNSNKGLMTSAANNNIQNNAAITAIGSTAATPATYEWTLSTTDRETYTLYNANASHYLDIYRPTSGGNAGKLIWAGNDTYETNEVHFFPLEERTTISIIPREWKSNGLVFAIDADNNISLTAGHTTAKIGTGDAASATLTRHSTGGYGLYEVALPALASHYGKVLTLKMKIGGVDTYAYTTIPIIVTGTTTTTTAETPFTALDAASKDYDVVILDGAKLTTNATASHASKFQNFYVYSGGTWINDNGSTSFNYLELRGGIKGIGAKDSHVQGVPHVMLNKVVTSTAGANLDMTVYTDHGYALSVPFDVDLSKVNFANSLKPGTGAQVNGTLASQFWIRKYDGAERAANGKGGWVDLEPEEVDEVMVYPTIHAGEGYTLQGKRPKGQPFAVIRFPFTGVASWANASGEVAKADIPIYAHAGTATTPDNDKGWNLIANPYMATIAYNTEDELSWAAAFKVGSLTETEGDTWDGKYQWTNATQAYVTIPNDSYTAFPQTRASKATFYPFKNFFIQTASNGVVAFVRTDRHEMPRHLMAQAEQMAPIYADINLAHGEESAQAGLTIDADATAGYQFGEDYTIFESREALDYLKVYTIADEHYLVGNTLTPTEAEEMIPLEFYAPSMEGAYVFSLDDGSDIDRLEYVILYDAELGLNTNLLSDYYTVELDKTGLIENRFYIGLKIKQKDNSATGIDDVGGDPDHPFKFLYRDKLYILRGGKLYDATGKQVKEINK